MIKIIKNNQLFLLIISFCLSAYFLGFYVREISNGAGHTDFQYHIWLLINDFDKNFSDTLKNYSKAYELLEIYFREISC